MTTTKELVILSQASQQIAQLFRDYETSSEQILERFRSDLIQLRRATLAKMEAILGEEPELATAEGPSVGSEHELTAK